jgi:subtilisin family serine protease
LYFSLSGQDPIEWSTSTLDNGGNLITVGNVLQGPGDADILVTKYSPGGILSWQESYDGPAGGLDYGLTLITDNQGAVYVAGVVTDTTGFYDMMLLKYSSAGALQWSRRWGGAAGLHDAPTVLYLDGSGNLIVAGVTYSVSNLTDWVIMKLSSSGSPQWVKTYDYNSLHEIPVRIEEDSTGQIVVSGFSQSGFTSWDMAQIPFAASDGSIGSDSRQGISGIDLDRPVRVAHNEAGELFIAGNAPGGGEKTLNIIKLDAEFEIAWTASHAQSGYDLSVRSVGVDEENRVFVAATAAPSSGPKHALLLSFDEEGELRWECPWRSLAPDGSAEARAMRVAPSGNVAMACVTDTETTGKDFATLIFDAEGVLRVSKQLNSANDHDDSPTDLSFVDEEAVYVTGTAKGGGVVKYLTAKYELMKQGTEVVLIDSVPAWIANELIVKFKPELVNTDFVDNLHRQFADLDAVIPDSVIWDLESRLDVELDRVTAVKIFTRMTTADTLSIARLGDTIPIPPFWSSLVLVFPEFMEIDSLVGGFNEAEEWVEYSEYNFVCQFEDTEPNDPHFLNNLQLSLHAFEGADFLDAHINILPAWELESGRGNIKVGVYDVPIFWAHEDFGDGTFQGSQIIGGYDYENMVHISEVTNPQSSHGTSAAGIIGARRDNNRGIAGIAGGGEDGQLSVNSGVWLYSMGIGNTNPVLALAVNAIYEGASESPTPNQPGHFGLHIMNHSWSTNFSNLLLQSVEFAFYNDVINVAARGNTPGDETLRYPACFSDELVINVGGSGTDGRYYRGPRNNGFLWIPEECLPEDPDDIVGYNFGGNVDIVAPGITELVTTTIFHERPRVYMDECTNDDNVYPPAFGINNSYQAWHGTSAAAPHVSGVAALMMSRHHISQGQPNNLAPGDVENIMQNFATDITGGPLNHPEGPDPHNGHGRLNAGESVRHVSLPCWTVWHSGPPDQVSIVNDSTYIIPSGWGDDTIRRYLITHTYSNEFDTNTDIVAAWGRKSLHWGVGSTYSSAKNANYEFNLQQNTANVTATTYVWTIAAPTQWYPEVPEYLRTPYSLHVKHLNSECLTNTKEIHENKPTLRLYPNPAATLVNIEWDDLPAVSRIEIISLNGQVIKVLHPETTASNSEIDVSGFAPGFYFIRLVGANSVLSGSFIKI